MQFQVPQNITMEDRIIGSLTAIQFGILIIGGGIAFYFFQSQGIPSPINQVLAILVAVFTVVMAVGKFNDQPMYRFIKFIVAFVMTPKVRVWHKKKGPETQLVRPTQQRGGNQQMHVVKNVTKDDIARLAVVLDSRGNSGMVPKVDHTMVPKPQPPTPAELRNK